MQIAHGYGYLITYLVGAVAGYDILIHLLAGIRCQAVIDLGIILAETHEPAGHGLGSVKYGLCEVVLIAEHNLFHRNNFNGL